VDAVILRHDNRCIFHMKFPTVFTYRHLLCFVWFPGDIRALSSD